MQAIILAAGNGSRLWPFSVIRNKSMLPISNMPIIHWLAMGLAEAGVQDVSIIGDRHSAQIAHHFDKVKSAHGSVRVVNTQGCHDAIDALIKYQHINAVTEPAIIVFGDCIIQPADLQRLLECNSDNAVLTRSLREEERSDRISFNASKDFHMLVHPRREGYGHEIVACKVSPAFFSEALPNTMESYDHIQVGMMPSDEKFLESALAVWRDKVQLDFISCQEPCFNIDYPWNILEANQYLNESRCHQITAHQLAEGAVISKHAILRGHVIVGKHSQIGDGVIFQGNAIIGEHTRITDGAIIGDNVVIGDHAVVKEHCKVADGSTIGNHAIVGHCAELDGVILDRTYLYHHCEISGVLGHGVDIGAGTVFGTLRFDDHKVSHLINGKRIIPSNHGSAVYMGDLTRTGVNTVIMPGVKVGCRSVVGASVVLAEDLSNEQIIQLEQQTSVKPWGSHRYGFN